MLVAESPIFGSWIHVPATGSQEGIVGDQVFFHLLLAGAQQQRPQGAFSEGSSNED